MPRFFIKKEEIVGDTAQITGGDAHHIFSVLRMRARDRLTVCDYFGSEYDCEIAEADRDRILLHILAKRAAQSEPPYECVLLMALPKGDKMDLIVQKSVELGVHTILPFSSLYTVVKLDEKTALKKTERWQKIAKSAAEQSGRGLLPQVCAPVSFKRALEAYGGANELRLICYEAEDHTTVKDLFSRTPRPSRIVFMIGAEGGFDKNEVIEAKQAGFVPVSLGKRILRCETAPLALLAQIAYAYEL